MKKHISKIKKCKTCGHVSEHIEKTHYFCDFCKKEFLPFSEGLKTMGYKIFDNQNVEKVVHRDFCSALCMFKKLNKERLNKNKWISLDSYLDKTDLIRFLDDVRAFK